MLRESTRRAAMRRGLKRRAAARRRGGRRRCAASPWGQVRAEGVLELKLDGHPAYIHSSQRTELTQRGLLDGMVFLKSERSSQVPGDYVTGDYAPDYEGLEAKGYPVEGIPSRYRRLRFAPKLGR